ncbi:MAG: transcriptional regulator [Bacteroidota bacterium]
MRFVLLCSCLFTFYYSSFASGTIDSLENVLNEHPQMDKERVDILNDLAYQYWIIDPLTSEKYSREALELAITLTYPDGMAYANRSIGVSHWARGNYEDGLNFLMRAMLGYESIQDTLNIANVMMNTGLIYSEQGSYKEALKYYKEALSTFDLLEKPKRHINTANHIGELLEKQGQYNDAYQYYSNALQLSDSLDYTYGMATAYLNLGSLYKKRAKFDSALHFCNKAFEMQQRNDDWHGKATSLYTMGTVYMLQEDYAKAEEKLLYGLNKAVRVSSKKLRRDIYYALNQVNEQQGKYKSAYQYLNQYTLLNDSLLDAEMLRNLVRLENKIALEQKEQKVQQQEYDLEILQQEAKADAAIRNGLILAGIALLVVTYLMYSRQRMKIINNKKLLAKNKEIFESQQALAEAELENSRLKEQELKQKIEFKNKELASYTLNFMQKNELLAEIKESIQSLKKSQDTETLKKLNSLNRMISGSTQIDREWEDFKRYFEEVHTGFFVKLKGRFPDITNNELRLCALLKLNMNLKEAANILGISPESVKTARYRLRKKLGLSKDENLIDFVINLENELVSEKQ